MMRCPKQGDLKEELKALSAANEVSVSAYQKTSLRRSFLGPIAGAKEMKTQGQEVYEISKTLRLGRL